MDREALSVARVAGDLRGFGVEVFLGFDFGGALPAGFVLVDCVGEGFSLGKGLARGGGSGWVEGGLPCSRAARRRRSVA